MALKNFTNLRDQIRYVQGVEEKLLKRKYTSRVGLLLAILGAVVEIIAELSSSGLFATIFAGVSLTSISPLALVGFALLVSGLAGWFFLRYTRFLLKEAREPFRYTFWVKPFEKIVNDISPALQSNPDDLHSPDVYMSNLLPHDIMDKLNHRIRRLSLLNIESGEENSKSYRAHIEIEGHYTLRTTPMGQYLQVMPRVSIGGKSTPKHLTHKINFKLEDKTLSPNEYEQVVERVYSRLSTEIYNRIQNDLDEKINLYPTSYLRASALAVEAEDFARSNTIDSYRHAIELFEDSLRYFNVATRAIIFGFLLRIPIFPFSLRFHYKLAEIKVGYAKCFFYQWFISTLSGRKRQSIHTIPQQMDEVVALLTRTHNRLRFFKSRWKLPLPPASTSDLEKQSNLLNAYRQRATEAYFSYPNDNWWRRISFCPSHNTFKRQQKVLFEAYLMSSITCGNLEMVKASQEMLKTAEAIRPNDRNQDALYLLASALLEQRPENRIQLLRKTTEVAPDFEFAQYLLAYWIDRQFRGHSQLYPERAEIALQEYRKTLQINYGNISALSAMGYIYWLLDDNEKALELFEQGLEIKNLFKQVYSAEVFYGLARIHAEGIAVEGMENVRRLPDSISDSESQTPRWIINTYEYYHQAISLDPSVGIFFPGQSYSATTDYFVHIGPGVLHRFEKFLKNAYNFMGVSSNQTRQSQFSDLDHPRHSILSYVQNDCANAFINFYYRFGLNSMRERALELFDEALRSDHTNKVADFGKGLIYNDYGMSDQAQSCFTKALKANPNWETVVLELLRLRLMDVMDQLEQDLMTIQSKKLQEKNKLIASSNENVRVTSVPISHQPQTYPDSFQSLDSSYNPDTRVMIDNAVRTNQQVTTKIIKDFQPFFTQSGLGAIYSLARDKKSRLLDDFISKLPDLSRLSEKDVRLLNIYNEIMLYSLDETEFRTAFQNMIKLKELFGIQDFLRKRNLINILTWRLEWWESVKASDLYAKAQALVTNLKDDLRENICLSLQQDPLNWGTLSWASSLEVSPFKEHLAKAMDEARAYEYHYLEGLCFMHINHLLQEIPSDNSGYHEVFPIISEVLKSSPTDPYLVAYTMICDYYINPDFSINTHLEEAYKDYEKNDKLNTTKKCGDILYYQQQFALSLKCFSYILKENLAEEMEDRRYTYRALANCYSELHQSNPQLNMLPKQISMLEELQKLFPQAPEYPNEIGTVYFRDGQFMKAYEHFKKAGKVDGKNPLYLTNMADSKIRLGDTEEGYKLYEEAIDLVRERDYELPVKQREANEAAFTNSFGLGCFDLQNYVRAEEQFRKAARLDPSNPIYFTNIGQALLNQQSFQEALVIYEKAVEIQPTNHDQLNWTGVIAYRNGDYNKAAHYFKKALKLDSENVQYSQNLATAYRESGKARETAEWFQKTAELTEKQGLPNSYLELNNAGIAFYQIHEYEVALRYFTEAYNRQNSDWVVLLNIADCHLYLGHHADAEDCFRKILRVHLTNPYTHSGLAEALYAQGEKVSALEHYLVAYRGDSQNNFGLLRAWRCLFEMPYETRATLIPTILAELRHYQEIEANNVRQRVMNQIQMLAAPSQKNLALWLSKLRLKMYLWSDLQKKGKNRRLDPSSNPADQVFEF